MERSWDRRTPWREIRRDEAEAFVHAALPAAEVVAIEPLRGGLRNINYRLTLAGGDSLVMRVYTADATACARETAVLRRVRSLAPVAEVVYAAPDADPPRALLSWLDGTPMDEVLAGADRETALSLAESAGAVLAAIHSVRFPSTGFLDATLGVSAPLGRWRDVLAPADWMQARLGSERAARLDAFVARHGDEGDALLNGPAVLCQGDFKPWNLLAAPSPDGGLRLSGVLDWEFVFAGHPLFDFATFLRAPNLRGSFADRFAAGYVRAGGRLAPDWRRLARILDLVNLCQLIEPGGDREVVDLVPLIDELIDGNLPRG